MYNPIFDNVEECLVPAQINDWVENEFPKKSRARCLFVIGPSKLGKTHWARQLVAPHIYWKNMVNLDFWNPEARLIIFDDFDWEFLPNPKGYLTQAGECTVTDKYRHKKTIVVNMPAIVLCNEMPKTKAGVCLSQDNYWEANGVFVYVNERMY